MCVVLEKLCRLIAICCGLLTFSTLVLAQAPQSAAPTPAQAPVGNEPAPALAQQPDPNAQPQLPAAGAPPPSPHPLPKSWFSREPLQLVLGEGTSLWSFTLYGFIEADYLFDSTRSFDEGYGSGLVARTDSYAGTVGRNQFTVRNTRFGFSFKAPPVAGIRTSARIEGDFFGNQPRAPGSGGRPEGSFYGSAGFRLRHAYLQLQTEYVDVLAGQAYEPFGFQNYFFPCSIAYFGVPNQAFGRIAQLRFSRSFELGGDFGLEAVLAAVRPAGRDAGIPDVQGGVRLFLKSWKGISTPGNLGPAALPLSVAVSGTVRKFRVNAFTAGPPQASATAAGWGLIFDALVPILAASDTDDRANRLTFTGELSTGSGIADLITAGGGAGFPSLPNPMMTNPAPAYTPNIDEGLVTFDADGKAHTINWWTFCAGLQYYLPPDGRLVLAANYTRGYSSNMASLFPATSKTIANLVQYADLNVIYDLAPAVRLALAGQYTATKYLDGNAPHNLRAMAQATYAF